MSLITDDQVKVHRQQDLMRLEEHLVAYDEHRVEARTKKLLEKQELRAGDGVSKQGVSMHGTMGNRSRFLLV